MDRRGRPEVRGRDLARGRIGLVLWGAPIVLILVSSALTSVPGFPVVEAGLFLVLGTAWLGATCLANGLRCGRVHCLIDGMALPALAFVGALNLAAVVSLPWSTFTSVLWLIVIASFVAEWFAGPYLRQRPARG